jgi:hypothetical protein
MPGLEIYIPIDERPNIYRNEPLDHPASEMNQVEYLLNALNPEILDTDEEKRTGLRNDLIDSLAHDIQEKKQDLVNLDPQSEEARELKSQINHLAFEIVGLSVPDILLKYVEEFRERHSGKDNISLDEMTVEDFISVSILHLASKAKEYDPETIQAGRFPSFVNLSLARVMRAGFLSTELSIGKKISNDMFLIITETAPELIRGLINSPDFDIDSLSPILLAGMLHVRELNLDLIQSEDPNDLLEFLNSLTQISLIHLINGDLEPLDDFSSKINNQYYDPKTILDLRRRIFDLFHKMTNNIKRFLGVPEILEDILGELSPIEILPDQVEGLNIYGRERGIEFYDIRRAFEILLETEGETYTHKEGEFSILKKIESALLNIPLDLRRIIILGLLETAYPYEEIEQRFGVEEELVDDCRHLIAIYLREFLDIKQDLDDEERVEYEQKVEYDEKDENEERFKYEKKRYQLIKKLERNF